MRILPLIFIAISFLFFNEIKGQIVNIEDKRFRLKDSLDFEGKMSLSMRLNKNTNTIWSGNGDILLAKNHLKSYFLAYGFVNLLRNGDNNLLNDRIGHIRYNRDLNYWLVGEAFLQGQFSEQLRIRYRYLSGGGLRYKLHKLIGKRIYLGTAIVNEEMGFQQNEVQASRLRLSSYVSFQIPLYPKASLVSTTYFQPTLKELSIRRISTQTKLILPIKSAFSFKSTFSLLSDNDPLIDLVVPDITYQWTNGVIWKISG